MPKIKSEKGFLAINQSEYRLVEIIIKRLRPRNVLIIGEVNKKLAALFNIFNVGTAAIDFSEIPNGKQRVTPEELGKIIDRSIQQRHFDLILYYSAGFDIETPPGGLLEKLGKIGDEIIVIPHTGGDERTPQADPPDIKKSIPTGMQSIDHAILQFFPSHTVYLRKTDTQRVTFILNTSEIHGGIIVILKYAQLLADRGHLVTLASWDKKYPNWANLTDRVRFVCVPQDNFVDFDEMLPDGDVLIATLWTTAPFVTAASAGKGRKYYLVQHYESLWGGDPETVDLTYTDLPVKKLVVSTWLKDIMRERFNEESTLVLNGCDFTQTCAKGKTARNSSDLRVGMLYHDAVWKGIDDGLYAFNVLKTRYPKAQLVLYGTKRPKRLPEGCSEFYEKPTRAELNKVLQTLDIFISPSVSEGFGLPALEAMCCGVPVVLTDSGGCRDYAQPQTALISPPSQPERLAENLVYAADHPGLRTQLSQAGVDIGNQFTWERSTDLMEQALKENESHSTLDILYVSAGYRWADAYHDPMFIRALRTLGHRVTEFRPLPNDWEWAKAFVNVELLDLQYQDDYQAKIGQYPFELVETVKKNKPDLVFFNHSLIIPSAVINDLHHIGAPTAVWNLDEPQEMYMSMEKGKLFDYVFLQDKGSLKYHIQSGNPNTYFLAHGMDPSMHFPEKPEEIVPEKYRSDLLLIGTGFPKRRNLIKSLAYQGIKVTVIGKNWEGIEGPDITILPMVNYAEAAKFYRYAKINLNIHREPNDMSSGKYIPEPLSPNASFFFGMGSGSLQLLDDEYPGASDFYLPGQHYRTFSDVNELIDTVHQYLENPEMLRRITREAVSATHKYHTYARRFEEALRVIGRPKSQSRKFAMSIKDSQKVVPLFSTALISRGNVAQLKSCLALLLLSSNNNKNLVVYHEYDLDKNQWLDEKQIPHRVIPKDSSLSESFNIAIENCGNDYAVILTDSVSPTIGFASHLASFLRDHPEIGVLAPALNQAATAQKQNLEFKTIEELNRAVVQLYLDNVTHFASAEDLDSACFAVNLKAIGQAGSFDGCIASGTLEMKDLCRRMRLSGWKTGWTKTAYGYVTMPDQPVEFRDLILADCAQQYYSLKWSDPNGGELPDVRAVESFFAGTRDGEAYQLLNRLFVSNQQDLGALTSNGSVELVKEYLSNLAGLIEPCCSQEISVVVHALIENLSAIQVQPSRETAYSPEQLFEMIINSEDVVETLERLKDQLDERFLQYVRHLAEVEEQEGNLENRDGLLSLAEYAQNTIAQRG